LAPRTDEGPGKSSILDRDLACLTYRSFSSTFYFPFREKRAFKILILRVIATFLIKQAGLKRAEAATGAVTLIQRFGSAANLNIHLHCLVLDGVYRISEGMPVFHPVRAPTAEQLQALLIRMIKRLMRLLTRKGYLIEEQGMSYLTDSDPEAALRPLQAAACTYRIALGPRAGKKY